ncbi:hypothetical protein L596_010909 [Steinernema carpocapsae]|uniref:Uncharacterized protein n=1 Tax=Steinernema carpocapsae TaxID=34508 RepID=A0A4U5PJR6_STECR|nr:hypothetical protein L596_010909 [Steinernema carpocapsae]
MRIRTKRDGACIPCINGKALQKKRTKRSDYCVQCTYLQPSYNESPNIPAYGRSPNDVRRSPVPFPTDPADRVKRQAGCLPHPQCTQFKKRSKRTLGSQYCEPCPGGLHGRKKRDAKRDTCLKRQKRSRDSQESGERRGCDRDDEDDDEEEGTFSMARMKRQAYNPSGILDIVKVLSRASTGGQRGPGGCMKFPSCVLAKKRRRKRHAERLGKYHEAVAKHKEELVRHKRQFYAPDQAANCVPCPAWVTLALASARKKREAEGYDKPLKVAEEISERIRHRLVLRRSSRHSATSAEEIL